MYKRRAESTNYASAKGSASSGARRLEIMPVRCLSTNILAPFALLLHVDFWSRLCMTWVSAGLHHWSELTQKNFLLWSLWVWAFIAMLTVRLALLRFWQRMFRGHIVYGHERHVLIFVFCSQRCRKVESFHSLVLFLY